MTQLVRWALILSLLMTACASRSRGDEASPSAKRLALKGLGGEVRVFFDPHGIPHIYADSRTDACRALGYVHATDRLGEMDLFRRQASGTMAEVRGKDALNED